MSEGDAALSSLPSNGTASNPGSKAPAQPMLHEPSSDDPFTVALDAEGLRSRSIGGSITTATAQVAKTAIQIGSQVILARLLFPADFGLLAMVTPLVTFIQLFNNLGLGEAIVQRQAISHARVSSLFWLSLASSFGVGALVVLVAPVAAWVYGEPRVIPLMIALAAMIPLGALSTVPGALFARQLRLGILNVNEVIAALVGVLVTVSCAASHLSFWSLIIGQAASMVTEQALAWARCGWRPSRPRIDKGVWADLTFGFNMTGFQLATFITSTGDNVIVGAMNGKVALGFYDRSYRLVVLPIGQMLAPISRVAVPLLSRLQDDPERYRQAYLMMLRYILWATVPAMLVCTTFPQDVVRLLLGPRWGQAAAAFGWIAVGGFASGLYSSLIWLYISQGKMNRLMRFSAVSSVFNIISFVVGAHWGINGVAASAALVFDLVSTPLLAWGATRDGPVPLSALLRCCTFYGIVAAIIGIAMRLSEGVLPTAPWLRFMTVAFYAYAGFALAIALSPTDRRQFARILRLVLPRALRLLRLNEVSHT